MILRSSDETESTVPTPEKQMVQVTNPFALELGSGPASVTGENSHYNIKLERWKSVYRGFKVFRNVYVIK